MEINSHPVSNSSEDSEIIISEVNSRGNFNFSSSSSYSVYTVEHQEVVIDNFDSSSEESARFEPVQLFVDGIETLPTPLDYIFANRLLLGLDVLIEDAGKATTTGENKKSIFFACVKSCEIDETEFRKIQVIRLGKSIFNYKSILHGNIIFAWYSAVTGNSKFILEPKIWHRLGFSSEDLRKNELQVPGLVLILLHLLFLKEKSAETMKKFKESCLNPNTIGSLLSISSILIKFSLSQFKSKGFSVVVSNSQDLPLLTFLNFHSGIILLFCEGFELAKNKLKISRIVAELKKKTQNFQMVIDLFKSQCID